MKKLLAALVCLGIAGVGRGEEAEVPAKPNVEAEKPNVEAAKPVEQPAVKPAEKPPEKAAPKFIIILPEQVDNVWYWTAYTTEQQHIVQSAVEGAFVDAGLDVIDVGTLKLSGEGKLNALLNPSVAAEKAREAGATYVIVGTATAVQGGESTALGIQVARSVATLSAKIVRVRDGKILAVKEAEANEGAQATRAAGQAALKTAGKALAQDLVSAAKKIAAE